jgi:hypothetical protein
VITIKREKSGGQEKLLGSITYLSRKINSGAAVPEWNNFTTTSFQTGTLGVGLFPAFANPFTNHFLPIGDVFWS